MESIFWGKYRVTGSQGRNGTMQTHGVIFESSDTNKTTSIIPINSKGDLGNCYITIPSEKSPIDALDAILEKKDLLPLLIGLHPLLDTLIAEKLKE